jgi:hypothetical protein
VAAIPIKIKKPSNEKINKANKAAKNVLKKLFMKLHY